MISFSPTGSRSSTIGSFAPLICCRNICSSSAPCLIDGEALWGTTIWYAEWPFSASTNSGRRCLGGQRGKGDDEQNGRYALRMRLLLLLNTSWGDWLFIVLFGVQA